jgi:carboxypeptidase Taq
MGLHECQARLWENHIGRSRAFWDFAFPRLRETFPDAVQGLDAQAMYCAANAIKPGVNRVSADEISYHLHIVLRYELEVALLSGALSVRDLPAAWRERSAALIGVTPSSDCEGVLQDVHWALGSFGYFPSYTLGSIYSAQLMEAYSRGHDLEREIERGEFQPLLEWLRTHVHRIGHRLDTEQIVANATGGSALDTEPFFRHLQSKIPAD